MIDSGYALAGALTGFVIGLSGVGGGALMTPILLLFFGVAPLTAIATDLWFAVATKSVAALIHRQGGQIDWRIVRKLWLGSLPMALGVVLLVSQGARLGKVGWLTAAIGATVLLTAFGLLLAPRLLARARTLRIGDPQTFKARQPLLTVIAGAILGVCVALTSVGAGAMGSVLLLTLYPLRLTPHRLVATDIAHAIPLALLPALGYTLAGNVDWTMLASLLTGSLPAVIAGSLLARRVSPRGLQLTLAGMLLLAGVKMLGGGQ